MLDIQNEPPPSPNFGFFKTYFSVVHIGPELEDQAGIDVVVSSDIPSKYWDYTRTTIPASHGRHSSVV